MAKHKQKQKKQKAERRRQQKRSDRNARKADKRGPSSAAEDFEFAEPVVRLPSIDPTAPERCFPPLHVDAGGRIVDDPYALLGVDRSASDEAIHAAWRRKILEHPPERDPEGARRLQEARARLLDPEKVLEREFGAIHIPDPAAHGLVRASERPTDETLPAIDRALGQIALYALLEELVAESEAGGGPHLR